jgi:hypothetical protein
MRKSPVRGWNYPSSELSRAPLCLLSSLLVTLLLSIQENHQNHQNATLNLTNCQCKKDESDDRLLPGISMLVVRNHPR